MDRQHINYNIEDTGALMTGTKGKNRTLMLILLIVAAFLLIVTAIFAFKTIANNRYNRQIEIADQAFVEGDYEAAYKKAVELNKRKPKARESLAYTLAIQDKTDESIALYEELYEDTGEIKYREASQIVSDGGLPKDNSLMPALGKWRETAIEDIPFYNEAADFLHGFFFDYLLQEKHDFDCKNPENFPALDLFMTGIAGYGYAIDEEDPDIVFDDGDFLEWIEGQDPRGWSVEMDYYELYQAYEVYDADKTDDALKNIFNISIDDIKESLQLSEANKQIYKENGKYYCTYGWPTGTPGYGLGIEIDKAWTDGEKYCIQYDGGYKNDYDEYYDVIGIDRSLEHATYYAILQVKTHNGKNYWSLYYNGKEIPAELQDALESKSSKQETENSTEKGYDDLFLEAYKNGNYEDARKYATMMPEIASEECVINMSADVKSAYDKEWDNYKVGSGSYEDFNGTRCFTDIDKDGTAEMIISVPASEADAIDRVYTYKDGKIKFIDQYSAGHTGYIWYQSGNGVIVEWGHMGSQSYYLMKLENGKLEREEYGSREYPENERYIEPSCYLEAEFGDQDY